jgi:hypothetical protein
VTENRANDWWRQAQNDLMVGVARVMSGAQLGSIPGARPIVKPVHEATFLS